LSCYLPSTISMKERPLVAVGHSKLAVPVSADPGRKQRAVEPITPRHWQELVQAALDLPRLAMEAMRHARQQVRQYLGPSISL
jgi:hypothetical protein